MMPPNTLRWTVVSLVAAAVTVAAKPQPLAQTAEPPPGQVVSEPGGQAQEPLFDESITVPELFEKAREAFGLDNFSLAEKFYQEILIRDRSNVQAMLELSNVYERSGKLEYARGLLARSAKLAPGNEAIASRMAAVERVLAAVLGEEVDSLIAAEQYELAVPKLSVHISIEPDNPELYYKRALCYARLGRPEGALSSIDKALQLRQAEKYHKLRSSILEDLEAEETREMVAEAKKLIESGTPEDTRRALDVLGEILEVRPDHAWARSQFLRLSGETGEGFAKGDGESGGGLPDVKSLGGFLVQLGRWFAGLVQRHLSAMLLLIAVLVVFRSRVTKVLVRLIAPRAYLSGRFSEFTLTEILLMLNAESHTGILHVKGDSCRGKIYIEKGEPCHCAVGKTDGVGALHNLLNNTKTGDFEFADGSIPLKRSIDTPLSVILVERSGDASNHKRHRAAQKERQKSKSKMKELLDTKLGK